MARILVVEADGEVRAVLAELLASAKHDVVVCKNGTDAIERLESSSDFDLILSDLTIPGGRGIALYWVLLRRWPHLLRRVVYLVSSVDSQSEEYRLILDQGIPLLLKPFEASHMFDVVAYMLRPPGR